MLYHFAHIIGLSNSLIALHQDLNNFQTYFWTKSSHSVGNKVSPLLQSPGTLCPFGLPFPWEEWQQQCNRARSQDPLLVESHPHSEWPLVVVVIEGTHPSLISLPLQMHKLCFPSELTWAAIFLPMCVWSRSYEYKLMRNEASSSTPHLPEITFLKHRTWEEGCEAPMPAFSSQDETQTWDKELVKMEATNVLTLPAWMCELL